MTSAIGKARPSMIKSLQYKAVTTLCSASLEKNRFKILIHKNFYDFELELVSKELNHFGGSRCFSEIGHRGH